MPIGKRTITVIAALGTASVGLGCFTISSATGIDERTRMTSKAQDAHASETAKQAADRFLGLVSGLNGTADLTRERIEQALQVSLVKGGAGEIYSSPDLGGGWTYGIERFLPRGTIKMGISFGFYNAHQEADPSPVCVLDLDGVRSTLTSHGFVESRTLGEVGDVVSWNFQKNDLAVVVGPRDFFAGPGGHQCIQTIRAIGRVSE